MQIYYKFGFPISRVAAQFACNTSRQTGQGILKALLGFADLSASAREGVHGLLTLLPTIPTVSAERALDLGKFYVLRLLSENERNIGGLLRRLDELQALIKDHKNTLKTPLTLSTIHSSKGLEYNRVFLLDIIDGILPSKPTPERKTEEDIRMYQEDRRLFYVAMTRAKSALYLFSCADSQSSFISEAMRSLPREIFPADDIFSFVHESLLGKRYTSKENGQGEILAQGDDRFLIKYSDGKTELLSLCQMAERRDTTVQYAPPKPEKLKKPPVTASKTASPQSFKVGKEIYHSIFGTGRIDALSSSGTNIIASISFDKTGDTKRFVLQDAVKKGLLRVIE